MKTFRSLLLVGAVTLIAFGHSPAQQPAPPVYGVVVSQQRGPVGGVTVSLVHPVVGRSAPSFSGSNGAFFFTGVPPRPDPYFIEAYWGNQLLYRGQITYVGVPVQVMIPLP